MPTVSQLPETAREVLIGVNPRAGFQNRQAIVEEFCIQLSERGLSPKVFCEIDELAGEAERQLAAGRLRAVVAAGGDGTIRLVADRNTAGTPLFVLPLGTENLLARYLELPSEPARLAQIVSDGVCTQLDAGLAGDKLFTLMAGCGFDAEVVRRLHQSRRGHIHHLSYAKPIFDAIRTYDYPELRVRYAPADAPVDSDLTYEISARWVFVVNLPRYAGGLSLAPRATGTDGLLDVCTFKDGSLWSGLLYLGGLIFGQHEAMSGYSHVQSRRVRIEAEGSVSYQLDGDLGGELPVDLSVLPGRLTMVVKRDWAEKQGFVWPDAA